jgi:hypothetical protein
MVCEPAVDPTEEQRARRPAKEVAVMDRYLSDVVREKREAVYDVARHWVATALRLLQNI